MLVVVLLFVSVLFIGLFFYIKQQRFGHDQPLSHAEANQRFVQQYHQHFHRPDLLLSDYTFVDPQVGLLQIDHIILTSYGIFVVEVKNYHGAIVVNEQHQLWTQSTKKTQVQFQNPMHKNQKHLQFLASLLQDFVTAQHLHSLIVFTAACQFKPACPHNVLQHETWVEYLQRFDGAIFSEQELFAIKQQLNQACLKPSAQMEQMVLSPLKNNQPTN